jgi:hypothetical protein
MDRTGHIPAPAPARSVLPGARRQRIRVARRTLAVLAVGGLLTGCGTATTPDADRATRPTLLAPPTAPSSTTAPPPVATTTVPAAPTISLNASDFRPVATNVGDLNAVTGVDGAIYLVGAPTSTATYTIVDRVDRVDRVDPGTGAVTASARLPGSDGVSSPVVTPGAIWLAGSTGVVALNPTTLRTLQRIPVPRGVSSLASAGGQLWVVSEGRLYRTPFDRPALTSVRLGLRAISVAANQTGTALAVALDYAGGVDRLDPGTGRVLAHYPIRDQNTTVAAVVGETAWVGEGGGHYNTLVGVRLATGGTVALSGLGAISGEGGWFDWSGDTLLATTTGGPEWCIDPGTGRAQDRIILSNPTVVHEVGAADHALYANVAQKNSYRTELERASLPRCG